MRNEERPPARVGWIAGLWLIGVLCADGQPASAQRFEVGGFAGYHAPLRQDDATDDLVAGARARIPIGGLLKLEPAATYYDLDRGPYRIRGVTQELDPWWMASVTLALTLGRDFGRQGYHPYVTGGAGYYFLRKLEAPDADRLGFHGGIGLVISARDDFSIDLSANLLRVTLDQGGARGFFTVTTGVNYHFGRL